MNLSWHSLQVLAKEGKDEAEMQRLCNQATADVQSIIGTIYRSPGFFC